MHGPNTQLPDSRATILKFRRPQLRRVPTRTAEPKPVSLALERFRAGEELVAPLGNRSRVYLAAKRLFDICGSLCLIVALSPILMVTFIVLAIAKLMLLSLKRREGK